MEELKKCATLSFGSLPFECCQEFSCVELVTTGNLTGNNSIFKRIVSIAFFICVFVPFQKLHSHYIIYIWSFPPPSGIYDVSVSFHTVILLVQLLSLYLSIYLENQKQTHKALGTTFVVPLTLVLRRF